MVQIKVNSSVSNNTGVRNNSEIVYTECQTLKRQQRFNELNSVKLHELKY